MAHDWHTPDTVPLLFLPTKPIELTVGGGLGCPDGAAGENGPNEA
jgi:hypothetical protein